MLQVSSQLFKICLICLLRHNNDLQDAASKGVLIEERSVSLATILELFAPHFRVLIPALLEPGGEMEASQVNKKSNIFLTVKFYCVLFF